MEVTINLLNKWKTLIDACKAYYIDSLPTGLSDAEFDELEKRAISEDGFFARDYVFTTFLKGTKTKNSYIEKIKKFKVEGMTMLSAIKKSRDELGVNLLYCTLKYDGSSIAIYLDPTTGIPKRLVTVGNLNLNNFGVDQTWKLINLIPKRFPKGILAIQAEALIDVDRFGDPEKARQKANGLINSKYLADEVDQYLTLRAYRYYADPESTDGKLILGSDYRNVIESFETVYHPVDGHVTFAPAQVFTIEELENNKGYCETDKTTTDTGTFLNDGWVLYNKSGVCQRALKYAGAGSGTESIKTTVRGIQWNDQSPKGKDSWSANVLVDPVQVRGCTIKKPSAGSVGKLVRDNISIGAEIGIILANSTIPAVGKVIKPGNGDFQWPTCSCGYVLSAKDIYGAQIKCGNPACTCRMTRMEKVIKNTPTPFDLDLNKFLVIDRFRWENTDIDLNILFNYVKNNDLLSYHDYLSSFLKTSLQKKTLDLVYQASFRVLQKCL